MLIAWYSSACVPNNAAITADTSSAPAANMVVVDPAAATLAALIVDPNRSKSDAATATISGATPTKDISHLPATRPWPAVTDTSKPCQATQHRAMVAARVTGGQGQNPPNQCAHQLQCAQLPTRGLPEKVGCDLPAYRTTGRSGTASPPCRRDPTYSAHTMMGSTTSIHSGTPMLSGSTLCSAIQK